MVAFAIVLNSVLSIVSLVAIPLAPVSVWHHLELSDTGAIPPGSGRQFS